MTKLPVIRGRKNVRWQTTLVAEKQNAKASMSLAAVIIVTEEFPVTELKKCRYINRSVQV